MADDNARELIRLSNARFGKKGQIDDLCQTVADEIHPARADFTTDRVEGEEFADHLYTSLPAQNLRDLAYAMGSLTRPKNQQWFEIKAQDDKRNTERAKAWFGKARDKQRTLIYHHAAAFAGTMEESDRDVIAFGNAVIGHFERPERDGLMAFQGFHFRDCAWAENVSRIIDELHRKFKLALTNWEVVFKQPLPKEYASLRDKDPHHEVELRHICIPWDRYDPYTKPKAGGRRGARPHQFASVYIDPAQDSVIREGGYFEFPYTVRRWQLQTGSPYARSPAADLGLVEARLLQNQERVLMDAGELAVDPPWIATRGAVLGDVRNYPGGVSYVDYDYDERGGAALRAVEHKGQLPIGLEMKVDTREILAAAMFINKLSLPVGSREMTVPEVNERISEYIRSIGPAVEPFEAHNAMLLDSAFTFNLRMGHFTDGQPVLLPNGEAGPGLRYVPPELRGADVEFEFDGPIQIAYRRQKLMKAKETMTNIGEAVARLPPDRAIEVLDNFDIDKIVRDGTTYIGGEPEWLVPEEEVAALREARSAKMAEAEQMAKLEQVGGLAKGAIETVPALAEADAASQIMLGGQGPSPLAIEGLPPGTGGGAEEGGGFDALAALGLPAPPPTLAEEPALGGEPVGPMPQGPAVGPPEFAAPAAAVAAPPAAPPSGGGGIPPEVAGLLSRLVSVLEAPVEIRRDSRGKPVGWKRNVRAA
jgi:head-to-tail connecting protein